MPSRRIVLGEAPVEVLIVRCSDCRNFTLAVIDDYSAWSDYCNAPTGEMVDDLVYGPYKKRVLLSPRAEGYPNRDGRCPYYRRKWWKWWAPKEAKNGNGRAVQEQ